MTDFRPQRPRLFVFVRHLLVVLLVLLVAGGVTACLVPIQEYVSASGSVRPRQEVPLHSLVDAVVLERPVEDGDEVQAGQSLMVLDDLPVRSQLAAQEDSLALKRADLAVSQRALERLRVAPLPDSYRFTGLELERARSRLASAEESLSRQQSLFDKGLASDQDLTDAKAAVALATIDLRMAERRDELVKAGMAETILEEAEAATGRIQAEVEVLQNQVSRTRELLSRFRIDAPVGGRVVMVTKKKGEPVTRGELVAEVAVDEERHVYLSPVAGRVVQVAKEQGDAVKQGELVAAVAAGEERHTFRSPIAGQVVQVAKRQGEPVAKGELVAEVASGQDRRVFLRVAERDIFKVRPGQPVHLYSSVFPYRQYGIAEGEVYLVEKWAGTSLSGATVTGPSYEVRAYINKAPYVLPLGSTVQGEILVGKKEIWRILLGMD